MDLFDRGSVERLVERLVWLLEQVVERPDVPLRRVSVLLGDERDLLVASGSGAVREVPGSTVVEVLEGQARRVPEAVALVAGGVELSLGELNARANRLARFLVAQGVGPEQVVTLALPRAAEVFVALWGVLKAGAVYHPVDPEGPVDRLEFVLADARPAVVVTTSAYAQSLAVPAGARVVLLD